MNRLITILFVVVTTCFAACREDDVAPEQAKCKKIMESISTYKQKSIDFSGRTQQDGSIAGSLDGDELKLAIAASYSQTGRREEHYFFHNNHLIAVRQQDFVYNKPQYITEEIAKTTGDSTWYDDTKTVMKTSWFYFYSSHMVKWIGPDGKIVPDNDRRFDGKDDELQRSADKLKQMLLARN